MSKENSPLGQAWRSHTVGRDDSAVEEFQKIASTSPEDIDVLYGLGLAQRGAGQFEEAMVTFKKVLAMLEEMEPEDDDEFNRVQMLTRMVNQQIKFLEAAG
jgi:Flp pilus assembly protein TadD